MKVECPYSLSSFPCHMFGKIGATLDYLEFVSVPFETFTPHENSQASYLQSCTIVMLNTGARYKPTSERHRVYLV